MNKYGDNGFPCFVPRERLKYLVKNPLFITQLLALKHNTLIHFMKSGPKPNFANVAKRKLSSNKSMPFQYQLQKACHPSFLYLHDLLAHQ